MSNARLTGGILLAAAAGLLTFLLVRGCPSPRRAAEVTMDSGAPPLAPEPDGSTVPEASADATPDGSRDAGPGRVRRDSTDAGVVDELVDRPEDCEDVCGAPCLEGADARLRCPPRCRRDEDCSADRACAVTRIDIAGTRTYRCLANECTAPGAANGCPDGEQCLSSASGSRRLLRCFAKGERGPLEACAGTDYAAVGTCREGLQCINGRCYPATCDDSKRCPGASQCIEVGGRRQCLPACTSDKDCEAGERCVRTPFGLVMCRPGTDPPTCFETGCPSGQTCVPESLKAFAFRTACAVPCDLDAPSCPDGQQCFPDDGPAGMTVAARCRRLCERDEDCGKGERCYAAGYCRFDESGAVDTFFNHRFDRPARP